MGRKVFLILDGASDEPVTSLGCRTPLEAAEMPHLNRLASLGSVGLLTTVPPEFTAASDVANLMLLGHDPRGIYSGRGPIEAAAMGIALAEGEIAFRVNTVSFTSDERMKDYSAGHITTEEARAVVESLAPLIAETGGRIYPGVQYRHLMVRRDGIEERTYPPHDNIGVPLSEITPRGVLGEIVARSREALVDHPVNLSRRERGLNTVDALWPWGQGRSVRLATIGEKYGVSGSLISAVDLIRGIGVLAGFRILKVPGITGFYDTNYAGKGEYAVEALKGGDDVVVIHVEAPDEAGHLQEPDQKVRALENIDREIVGRLVEAIPDLALAAAPDHPTFVRTGKHGSDPVPCLLTDLRAPQKGPEKFAERFATGEPEIGSSLFERLMRLPD